MEALWQDLRYSARRLAKTPGFSLVAVLVLALGIGPNSAAFSIVNAVLLRSLPFNNSERIVSVWETYLKQGFPQVPISAPNFCDWREQNRVFEEMTAGFAMPEYGYNITAGDEPERVAAGRATANYFQVMGIKPYLGRAFFSEEDRPGGSPVVMISHGLWERRFGKNPAVDPIVALRYE